MSRAPIDMQSKILNRLSCNLFAKPQEVWLDVGNKYFNSVFGSPEYGLPAGKLYHLAGKLHGGKTALAAWLAGKAQKLNNAFVIWIDAENSFDYKWMQRLGLTTGKKDTKYNCDNFYLVYPKILNSGKARGAGKSKKKAGTKFLQSCEFLFQEAEEMMTVVKEEEPDRPIFVVVDSIAMLQTAMRIEQGNTEKNMRGQLDRAQFLDQVMPRWVSLAKNYTMWVFMLNQVRTNPTVLFGDKEYSPGGKALGHACHVMAIVRRKGGDVKDSSISGYIVNKKNKAGGGSLEGQKCSYKVSLKKKVSSKKIWRFAVHKKREIE